MESLATELKAVITRRLHSASCAEVLAIASALTEDDAPIEFRAPAPDVSVPFVKIGADGQRLEKSATSWEVVLDTRTGLMWTRRYLGKRASWATALEQPKGVALAGYSDWELPSIRQQLTLVDYERSSPAIDTDHFEVESDSDWCWTRTRAAASPGDLAWFVYFSYGGANWLHQSGKGFVRGCRASQAFLSER